MWMCLCPGERLLFGTEKTIDNDGSALSPSPPTRARVLAIDDARSAVHGHTRRIRKDNFTAIGNSFWIDSAMPFVKPHAVPGCMLAGAFAMPVNRDARER